MSSTRDAGVGAVQRARRAMRRDAGRAARRVDIAGRVGDETACRGKTEAEDSGLVGAWSRGHVGWPTLVGLAFKLVESTETCDCDQRSYIGPRASTAPVSVPIRHQGLRGQVTLAQTA